jgi:predicted RecB family nuclease
VGWTQWKLHREFGVTNRAQLAGLDTRTAGLVAAKVDVAGLMQKVQQLEPGQPLGAVQGISLTKRELRHLSDAGIATCGDLQALDAATGRYTGVGMASLVEQIDLARAALGPEPVYRRRGVDRIVVPWADVEVDIDMESIEAGAYLWGTLVTRRAPGVDAAEATYVPFVTWDPLTAEVEAANSRAFWDWLMQLRQDAEAAGRTFAAFCWNAPAENQFLRRLGRMDGIADAVEAFIASDEWVDLLKVWDGQVVTGGPSGLKEVAPLGGVAWTVDDPGGAESMVRYDVAMGAAGDPERAAARRWLLEYNAGDVRATRAIREWLTHAGSTIPSVESLDPRVID